MFDFIKPALNYVVNYFTQNDPKPAQVYAQGAASRAVDNLDKAATAATALVKAFKEEGATTCAMNTLNEAVVKKDGNAKALLFAVPEMIHDYKNYRYLAGQKPDGKKYQSKTVNTNEDGTGFDFEDLSEIKPFHATNENVEVNGLNVSFIKLDENENYPAPRLI